MECVFLKHLSDDEVKRWLSLDERVQAYLISEALKGPKHTDITDIKPAIKGSLKVNDVRDKIKFETIDCSSRAHSTDLRVVKDEKTVYVEVKSYTGTVPQKELDKFFKDLNSKCDIFGALFIGWKQTQFLWYHDVPVFLLKDDIFINEALEMLFALIPRKKIDKVLNAVDEVVNMINIIDNLETHFQVSVRKLRESITIFKTRCEIYPVEVSASLHDLNLLIVGKHCSQDPFYSFIIGLLPGSFKITGKQVSFLFGSTHLKLTIYKTKTLLTISHRGYDQTFDLTPASIPVIQALLL